MALLFNYIRRRLGWETYAAFCLVCLENMAPKRSGSTQKTDKLPTDLIKRMKSKLEYLVKTKNSEQAREVAKAYESGDHETKLSMLHEFQSDPSLSWSYKFTRKISETHKIGSCSTE